MVAVLLSKHFKDSINIVERQGIIKQNILDWHNNIVSKSETTCNSTIIFQPDFLSILMENKVWTDI